MAFRKVMFGEDIGSAGDIDGELLPIKCICGYGEGWDFPISIYKDRPYACPKCRRKYYFSMSIQVFCEEADDGVPGKTMEEMAEEGRIKFAETAKLIDELHKKRTADG